jgi:hypothetical protein
MAGVIGAVGKALPLIGGGLGLISKIGGGIAGLFNRGNKNKAAGKAQEVFRGIGSVGGALGGFGGNQLREGGQRSQGIQQGAMNMYDRGREAVNYGRQFIGGMRDSYRSGDYGGMMNQVSEGMGRFGQMGRGMVSEGRNLYDQGRQAVGYGQGVYNDMRNQYQSGVNMSQGMRGPSNGINSSMLEEARRRLRPVRF